MKANSKLEFTFLFLLLVVVFLTAIQMVPDVIGNICAIIFILFASFCIYRNTKAKVK